MVCKDRKIIISIGSNWEQVYHVKVAKEMLTEIFPGITFTPEVWTDPIGINSDKFLNLLALAYTQLSLKEVETSLKQIEKTCGRKMLDKEHGLVKLDLDVLLFGDTRLHERDWSREYVQRLMGLLLFKR